MTKVWSCGTSVVVSTLFLLEYCSGFRYWCNVDSFTTGKLVREFKQAHTSHIFDVKFDVTRIVRYVLNFSRRFFWSWLNGMQHDSTSHDQKIVVLDFSTNLNTALFVWLSIVAFFAQWRWIARIAFLTAFFWFLVFDRLFYIPLPFPFFPFFESQSCATSCIIITACIFIDVLNFLSHSFNTFRHPQHFIFVPFIIFPLLPMHVFQKKKAAQPLHLGVSCHLVFFFLFGWGIHNRLGAFLWNYELFIFLSS